VTRSRSCARLPAALALCYQDGMRSSLLLAVSLPVMVGCGGGAAVHAGSTGSGGTSGSGGSGSSSSAGTGTGGSSDSAGTGGSAVRDGGADGGFAVSGCDSSALPTRFISCVLSYTPGQNAGFGQDEFPEIVYGPPVGAGTLEGSIDVVTLGGGGEIAFGFGGNAIVDGPGPDFILFENPWFIGGDPTDIWAEPGVVSVSDDAQTWVDFPCQNDAYPYTGCGGWHPVLSNPDNGISPLDPTVSGGDAFDLADIGVTHARYVRIHDVSFRGGAPTEGFDLDAAAIVNAETP
jgi:hypothetical protein